jgi:hypothetical protein
MISAIRSPSILRCTSAVSASTTRQLDERPQLTTSGQPAQIAEGG